MCLICSAAQVIEGFSFFLLLAFKFAFEGVNIIFAVYLFRLLVSFVKSVSCHYCAFGIFVLRASSEAFPLVTESLMMSLSIPRSL